MQQRAKVKSVWNTTPAEQGNIDLVFIEGNTYCSICNQFSKDDLVVVIPPGLMLPEFLSKHPSITALQLSFLKSDNLVKAAVVDGHIIAGIIYPVLSGSNRILDLFGLKKSGMYYIESAPNDDRHPKRLTVNIGDDVTDFLDLTPQTHP